MVCSSIPETVCEDPPGPERFPGGPNLVLQAMPSEGLWTKESDASTGRAPQSAREGGPSGKGPTRQMPPATLSLCEELLLPKERNHQFLQLHSRLPASGEEEAARHLPGQAVPEGPKDSEPAGPSGSLLQWPHISEAEPA